MIPKRRLSNTVILGWERHLLQKNYEFVQVRIISNQLICLGECTPCELSTTYSYKIKFAVGYYPKVYAVSPKIEYHEDIHIYPQDNSLCLFYPKDFSWTATSHLYDTIVPWTHEWFLFYELYLIHGKWMHPSVAHKDIKQQF